MTTLMIKDLANIEELKSDTMLVIRGGAYGSLGIESSPDALDIVSGGSTSYTAIYTLPIHNGDNAGRVTTGSK